MVKPIVIVPSHDHLKIIMRNKAKYLKAPLDEYELICAGKTKVTPDWVVKSAMECWKINYSNDNLEDVACIRTKNQSDAINEPRLLRLF